VVQPTTSTVSLLRRGLEALAADELCCRVGDNTQTCLAASLKPSWPATEAIQEGGLR
jgi:hypothetical protein